MRQAKKLPEVARSAQRKQAVQLAFQLGRLAAEAHWRYGAPDLNFKAKTLEEALRPLKEWCLEVERQTRPRTARRRQEPVQKRYKKLPKKVARNP